MATDRRTLLLQATATATVAGLWLDGILDLGRVSRTRPTREDEPRRSLDENEWDTLGAAEARVLPSGEGSPGAREVNAIGYLDAVLADPAVEEETAARIRAGVKRLTAFARERGASRFSALNERLQDEGIRLFEADWESHLWLRSVIAFAMEAFLGDPRHGANPAGIGWTWAGHRPGSPRPPPDWRPIGEGPRG